MAQSTSLRGPTGSPREKNRGKQEANREEKASACSARNDMVRVDRQEIFYNTRLK
jgi:hypothetical protein